jgi:hypothetical protein
MGLHYKAKPVNVVYGHYSDNHMGKTIFCNAKQVVCVVITGSLSTRTHTHTHTHTHIYIYIYTRGIGKFPD